MIFEIQTDQNLNGRDFLHEFEIKDELLKSLYIREAESYSELDYFFQDDKLTNMRNACRSSSTGFLIECSPLFVYKYTTRFLVE